MKLFNDFIKEYLYLSPMNATYIGIHDYDDRLINYYEEKNIKRYNSFLKKYIKLVKEQLSKDNNSKNEHYLKVLKYRLEMDLEGNKYKLYYLPIDSLHNTILNWVEFCTGKSYIKLVTVSDFNNFLSRISLYLEIIESMIDRMNDGIYEEMIHPKVIIKKVIVDLEKVLKNKDYLLEEDKIPKIVIEDYDLYIKNLFPQKIKKMLNYLNSTYIKKCHNGFGLLSMKNGKNIYDYLVRYHTTLKNPNIPEIHKLGLLEVKRIDTNIKNLFAKYSKIYPDLIEPAKLSSLKKEKVKDKRVRNLLFYKDEEDIVKSFKTLRESINKTVMKKYFDAPIKINTRYDIKKVPKFLEENNTGAYYQRSNVDLSRKGTFYINVGNVDEVFKCNSYSLAIHEGNPGHHYQTSYSNDMKNPLFISFYEDETSYVEGWGLYAEYIGRQYILEREKKKILKESEVYDLFGSFNMEMLRALRLVVDTGIHYYGWDFKKCFQYMEKFSELGKHELENEIYRYSVYPGQALSYKIGELTFKKLKTEYLAKGKNIKEFHHDILKHGSCPLWLL